MPRNPQALWGQQEIFQLIHPFMDSKISDQEVLRLLHLLSGWMIFSKDDTLLGVYLEACMKRLTTLEKASKKDAAKEVLKVAKNYKYSKEYKDLLYLCKSLYQDDV